MSDQLANALKRAAEVVEQASVPDDLRSVAFASAFWAAHEEDDATGRTSSSSESEPSTTAESRDSSPQAGLRNGGFEKIAQKLGISLEDAEAVFELDGDDLRLNVPASRFAPSLKEAVEQIVYLVAAGRQAVGLETRTVTTEIKAVCKDRGKTSSNFGRIVDDLHGHGVTVGGSGHSRTIGVNAVGFERAGEIVRELSGPRE